MYRAYYEVRILGWQAIAPPLLILIGGALGAIAITALTAHGTHATLTTFLTALCEMLLPLAAGMICAMTLLHDTALELQLALPASFAATTLLRWGLLVAWVALCVGMGMCIIVALGLWHVPSQIQGWAAPQRFLAAHLIWLAPLLWLSTVGLTLALLLRNPIASATLLGGIWISETFAASAFTNPWLQPFFLFPTTFTPGIDFWLLNRLELLATVIIALPFCWWLLRDHEAVFQIASTGQGD
ncbi:MAG: hypothetical protein ACLQUY_03730 [Ktedonobacterales bacterium]